MLVGALSIGGGGMENEPAGWLIEVVAE